MITQRIGFTMYFTKKWNNLVYFRLSKIRCGFKDQVRARPSGENCGLTRPPLIHSYGYESVGDRPTWLFVSSMRLTPTGLARKIFPEDFLASLPLNSKSFMQYAG